MIVELVLFFTLVLGATTLIAVVPGVIGARFWLAIPACVAALACASAVFVTLAQDRSAAVVLGVAAAVATTGIRVAQPRWSWTGAQLMAGVALASLAYLAYAGLQTFGTGIDAPAVVASVVLLVLEAAALALASSYAFEIVDVLGRRERRLPPAPLTHTPRVVLQVPTYNEPVEVVRDTLESLARIDYPDVVIQVVDNNTKDPTTWQPLERLCHELGDRFRFIHLDPWPGYKAGALNEATRRLEPEVEIIGIVDADYTVRPDFLRSMIGHFDDPAVAFVQSSQHYREWEDDRYLRGLFYSFRYFFDLTMPARSHRNAIIFCGTMGLIRRSVLEEIGGWSETCITEDAEASLRMLGRGYRGVYDPTAYGAGLMPLSFDGLKKQRFRWALGGIQILRAHARELIPFARHRLRLTRAQRAHYLLGSVQWFGELLSAVFTVLLLLTAVTTALHHRLPVRQLTGAVLVIPVAFAATGLLRALWAMRRTTRCSTADAVGAMRVWFALSWVVTLACLRGLVSRHAEFLRTPKHREGATLLQALRSSRGESALATAGILGAAAMVLRSPGITTVVLGVLLLFEAGVYSNAAWASMGAEGIRLTPERRRYLQSPQSTGERPVWRHPAVALPTALLAAAGAAVAATLVVSAPSDRAPFGGPQRDLPAIGQLTGGGRSAEPAATPPPTPSTSPSPTATTTPPPSAPPSVTPPPATPASSPTPAPSATPAASATPAPSATPGTSPTPPALPSPT